MFFSLFKFLRDPETTTFDQVLLCIKLYIYSFDLQ